MPQQPDDGNPSAKAGPRRGSPTGERRAAAYKAIRDRILNADYRPGVALSEYQIAASLNVSRTPVREALKQLEQEGLVRSIPQKGVFVTDLTVSDIDEIYQIREQLETMAARIAAVEMNDDEIKRLIGELKRAQETANDGSVAEAFDADVDLHKTIIKVARNYRLAQILSTLDDQVHRMRHLSPQTPGRLAAALDEHLAIAERLSERDPEGAAAAMQSHLRKARDNAIRLMRLPQ